MMGISDEILGIVDGVTERLGFDDGDTGLAMGCEDDDGSVLGILDGANEILGTAIVDGVKERLGFNDRGTGLAMGCEDDDGTAVSDGCIDGRSDTVG